MLKPTRNKRRIAALTGTLALSACLALGLAGCAGNEGDGTGEPAAPATEQEVNADAEAAAEAESGTITFTDDLGRTVELPAQIDKICPSGFTAQQVLLTMAPDKMVGLAQELNDDQLKIFGEKFADYPVFGAVLGAKDDLNREAVAAAAPQVIIDTGEAKKGAKEDLDALQEQLGIPVIFIEAKLSDYGAAYERLGELLGMEERGSELSTYCTDVYNETVTTMENIPENERVRMAYLLGDNGLNAIAKTSFQAAVVDTSSTTSSWSTTCPARATATRSASSRSRCGTPTSLCSRRAAFTTPWAMTRRGPALPPSTPATTIRCPTCPTAG